MDIQFSGTLTKAEFQQAVKLASRPTHWVAAYYILTGVLVLLAGVMLVQSLLAQDMELSGRILRSVAIGAVLVWILARPTIQRTQLTRKAEQAGFFDTRLTGYANNEGIVYRGIENDRPLPWQAFNRFRQDDNLVVLLTPDGTIAVFPRAHFASNIDWNNFRTLAAEKMQLPTK